MHEWIKALIHPLGLTGFVLFLVFGLFAKVKQHNERRWLVPSAIAMAFIALVGGLGLAYIEVRSASAAVVSSPKSNPTPGPVQQQTNQVQQVSTGPGSPNIQGVQGSVTLTVDQSSGKVEPPKTAEKKIKEKKKQ